MFTSPVNAEPIGRHVPATRKEDGNNYCFVPDANGSFSAKAGNNTFNGSITHPD